MKRSYPPKVEKVLREKGYFTLSREERVASHKRCLSALSEVNRGDDDAGRVALRIVRGRVLPDE